MKTYYVSYMYKTDILPLTVNNESITISDAEGMTPGETAQKLKYILGDMYPRLLELTLINYWEM